MYSNALRFNHLRLLCSEYIDFMCTLQIWKDPWFTVYMNSGNHCNLATKINTVSKYNRSVYALIQQWFYMYTSLTSRASHLLQTLYRCGQHHFKDALNNCINFYDLLDVMEQKSVKIKRCGLKLTTPRWSPSGRMRNSGTRRVRTHVPHRQAKPVVITRW